MYNVYIWYLVGKKGIFVFISVGIRVYNLFFFMHGYKGQEQGNQCNDPHYSEMGWKWHPRLRLGCRFPPWTPSQRATIVYCTRRSLTYIVWCTISNNSSLMLSQIRVKVWAYMYMSLFEVWRTWYACHTRRLMPRLPWTLVVNRFTCKCCVA